MFWNTPGRVVLVVEDEPTLLFNLSLIFEDNGIETASADNADDAIRILAERTDIGVLLTDIELVGSTNGLELAAKAAEMRPKLQIVIVSGIHFPDDSTLPADALFLPKPYDPDDLASMIKQKLT